ncbi:MAG: PA2778 family cysteine peptidase [Chromatiales bacterium]|nr:PA2778 family cysteine peptidase [Chromatiales bacterium]
MQEGGPELPASFSPPENVPFFPQSAYQCGPAALATVLVHSGANSDPETLVDQVWIPGRRGSLQLELLAATRRAGRIPWVLPEDPAAIWQELGAGNPVLVLQDLGIGPFRRWHYAVVVDYDPDGDRVILRSGTRKAQRERLSLFQRSWSRGGNWGVVVHRPGELPASAEPAGYVRTLTGAGEVMPAAALAPAWAAAAERWPEDFLVLFGAANAALERGDLAPAEYWYRRLLALGEEPALVHNNLANLLLARNCPAEALRHAHAAADALVPGTPWREAVERTRARAEAAMGASLAADCPPAPAPDG